MNQFRFVSYISNLKSVLLALVMAAVLVGSASAQEPEPPPDPTGEAPLVIVTPEPDTELVLENEGAHEAAAPEQEGNNEVPPEPLLDGVPDGTELIVLGDEGEQLSLVSKEAVEVVKVGDPIWCPAKVTVPKPNLAGCSPSFVSLDDLFQYLETNPSNVDGTIWIEKTYASSTDAILDGSLPALATMRNYRLNLKGAWNGCGANPPATCVGTVDINSPSIVAHRLEISSWNHDLTLSDLVITGVVDTEAALQLETSGNIVLANVEVTENESPGALLDNTSGQGAVTVRNSEFVENSEGIGLRILSNGVVSLLSSAAEANGGDGVSIDNDAASTPRNVTVSNSTLTDNEASGLVVISKGQISLTNIISTGNQANGATLDNRPSSLGASVALIGMNAFAENLQHGLVVTTDGQFTAGPLVNNANSGWGLLVNNTTAAGAIGVTLSGVSEFKFNGGGLLILSNGSITLAAVSASNNALFAGALLDNSSSTVGSSVSLAGVFNSNAGHGLEVESKGAISLKAAIANGNGQSGVEGYGARLDNSQALAPKAVTLSSVNSFSNNFSGGLFILSTGPVGLSATTASNNDGIGIAVDNTTANPAASQAVNVTGQLQAHSNLGAGVVVASRGVITLISLSANNNGSFGVALGNATSLLPRPITISGWVSVKGNNLTGLFVTSRGVITANNIEAKLNLGAGTILDNEEPGALGGVSVGGTSYFTQNGSLGLHIATTGVISVGDIKANQNGSIGVKLSNLVGANTPVSLGKGSVGWCNEMVDNLGTGLEISSTGMVTLYNVCANLNGELGFPAFGLVIDNSTAPKANAVTLKGASTFLGNFSGGLQVHSKGVITLSSISAFENVQGFGARLDNTFSGTAVPQAVTLAGVNSFVANHGTGLLVSTYGAISTSNISARTNGTGAGAGHGAVLENASGALTPKSITMTGQNLFSSNMEEGLVANSLGGIVIGSLSGVSNGGSAALLNNSFTAAVGGVTISGKTELFGNGEHGLSILSRGAIQVSNIDSSSNVGFGATLDNSAAATLVGVSVNGLGTFVDNGTYGLLVQTRGAISIGSLVAANNGSFGVTLDNSMLGGAGTVSIKQSASTNGNGEAGIQVISNRAVSLNSLNASNNQGLGVFIDNDGAGVAYDVTIAGSNFFSLNDLSGLEVRSLGAVTLNNLTALGNGVADVSGSGFGIYVNNLTGATVAKQVTVNGINRFEQNFDAGLYVVSSGAIKTSALTALQNGQQGVYLANHTFSASTVMVTGSNYFEGNGNFGLTTLSRAAISLNNLLSFDNLAGGALIDNSFSTLPIAVTITGVNEFTGNLASTAGDGAGLLVKSKGAITISNLTANENAAYGAKLDTLNYTTAANSTIKITGYATLSHNGDSGLYVLSAGDASLTKLVADQNVGDGVNVVSNRNISLICASLTSNDGYGLFAFASMGSLTRRGVFAYGNAINVGTTALSQISSLACP